MAHGYDYKAKNTWHNVPNTITFIWDNSCAATPWIYLRTLRKPVGHALLTLLSFGLSDLLIGYFRPKGLRSGSRFGVLPKRLRQLGRDRIGRAIRGIGFPEIGNDIGRLLPGSKTARELTDSSIGHMFWLPIDIAERGLYYWMIADVSKTFAYDWASALYKTACDGQAYNGYYSASGSINGNVPGPFGAGLFWHEESKDMYVSGGSIHPVGPKLIVSEIWASWQMQGDSLIDGDGSPATYTWIVEGKDNDTGEWKFVEQQTVKGASGSIFQRVNYTLDIFVRAFNCSEIRITELPNIGIDYLEGKGIIAAGYRATIA